MSESGITFCVDLTLVLGMVMVVFGLSTNAYATLETLIGLFMLHTAYEAY